MKAVYTFSKEGTKAGTLVNCALGIGKAEVSTSPGLLEGCQKSAKETSDETQEPQRVYPDSGSRRLERRYRSWGEDLRSIEKLLLLRYLCEEDDRVVWQ